MIASLLVSDCSCSFFNLSQPQSHFWISHCILGWILSELIAKNVPKDQVADFNVLSYPDQLTTRPRTSTFTKKLIKFWSNPPMPSKEIQLTQWLGSKIIMYSQTLEKFVKPPTKCSTCTLYILYHFSCLTARFFSLALLFFSEQQVK